MPEPEVLFLRGPWPPLYVDRAEGAYLFTAAGRKILDAGSGAVVVNVGQGRAELAEIAAASVRRLNYIVPVWISPERVRLVNRLRGWTPPELKRFFFTSGGSESIEMALKFTLLYHKAQGRPSRRKFISRRLSYHGNTLGALSAGSSLRRADYEPVLFDWPKIPPCYCYRCPWGKTYPSCGLECARALEAEIQRQGPENVAAFIAEPMIGSSAGAVPPVKEYWPSLREICRRYGVVLIADEVMTGFGRTGRRFALDHWNVAPDILAGGKGLAGGYVPMGMIAVDERLAQACEQAGADFMFFTYSCHPLACAMADGVLGIMERERLVERAAELGPRLGAALKDRLSSHPMAGDIRGSGLFWGVELVRDRERRIPYAPEAKCVYRVLGAALARGLFFYPASGMAGAAGGDAIMVAPPFVIGDSEIDFIADTLRAALDEVRPQLP